MKTSDIPDKPVLELLAKNKGHWTFMDLEDGVMAVMGIGKLRRLALSKMKSMIRRGLVTGCDCGCRGDFEITAKGEQAIKDGKLSFFVKVTKAYASPTPFLDEKGNIK